MQMFLLTNQRHNTLSSTSAERKVWTSVKLRQTDKLPTKHNATSPATSINLSLISHSEKTKSLPNVFQLQPLSCTINF